MNSTLRHAAERLYLHRDENDKIYVDSMLHQHHIDGIRFLYKQFKKNKLGVIINNPLGYGNSLQVALFLGAIRHLLDKPMLILCEQSEELNWLEHFQKLTQCYNVGIAAPNPFVKKSIFINTMENLEQFCRRDWSVMVVDNDLFLKEKTLQAKFKADFKIWITPLDMKDHLQMFASIFKWLFPKDKFNPEDFTAKPGDFDDVLNKSILLDAFLEDIVCRTSLQTPFENPYEKCEETPRKISKKNKDATGTKIKRSKRTLDNASTSSSSEIRENSSGASAEKIPKIEDTDTNDFSIDNFIKSRNNKRDAKDNGDVEDIESFINNEEPIKYDPYQDFVPEFDDISRNSQESKDDSMDNEPFFDTVHNLNRLLQSDITLDIAANPEGCFMDSDSNSDSLLPVPKTFDEDQLSNDSDYGDVKQPTPEFLTDNIYNEIKEEMTETHKPDTLEDNDKDDEIEIVQDSVKEEKKSGQDTEKEGSAKKDLDAKIKEIDEQTFKKFQGSILDRLF